MTIIFHDADKPENNDVIQDPICVKDVIVQSFHAPKGYVIHSIIVSVTLQEIHATCYKVSR